MRKVLVACLQIDQLEDLGSAATGGSGFFALEEKGEFHVFENIHRGQEVEELKNEAKVVAAVMGEGFFVRLVKGDFSDKNLALAGMIESAHEVEERAFSATAGAGDGDEFFVFDAKVEFAEGGDATGTGFVPAGELTTDDHKLEIFGEK
jgi:hypothetical protein